MIKLFLSKISQNKQKVITNIIWALLGKVATASGVFLVGILVARYLGPEKYGLMNYVISFVTLFTVVAEFGFGYIIVRELSKNPDKKNEIMGSSFLVKIAFSTLAYFLVLFVNYLFNSDSETFLMIALYGLYFFTTPFTVIRSYFTSIVQNKYIVKSEISRTCIGALIKVILLYFEFSIVYFVCAAAFDFALVAGGYVVLYKTNVGDLKDWKFSFSFAKFLCSESWPLALSASAIIFYHKIDQVMIKTMINDESAGYFACATSFLILVMFLPGILAQTITPLLVKLKKEKTSAYLEKRQIFVDIMVWGALIASIIITLCSYWIIKLSYGDSYVAAVPILQILTWKTIGNSLNEASRHLIIIEGRQKWVFIQDIFGCISCVLLNLIFIPFWGIAGSALVAVITTLITGFLSLAIIPPYRPIFKVELNAILWGWKDLIHIKKFFYVRQNRT